MAAAATFPSFPRASSRFMIAHRANLRASFPSAPQRKCQSTLLEEKRIRHAYTLDDMSCPPASVTNHEKAKDNKRTPQSLRACVTTPASSAQGPAVTHGRGSNRSGGWGPKPCWEEGVPDTLTQTEWNGRPSSLSSLQSLIPEGPEGDQRSVSVQGPAARELSSSHLAAAIEVEAPSTKGAGQFSLPATCHGHDRTLPFRPGWVHSCCKGRVSQAQKHKIGDPVIWCVIIGCARPAADQGSSLKGGKLTATSRVGYVPPPSSALQERPPDQDHLVRLAAAAVCYW